MKKVLIVSCVVMIATFAMSVNVSSENFKSFDEHILVTNAYDPSGVWNLEIEVPGQTIEVIMTISKDDDGDFEVSMEDTSENETREVDEVSFDEEEMILTGEISEEGTVLELELEFDDDSVEGKVSAEGMEIQVTGERETD